MRSSVQYFWNTILNHVVNPPVVKDPLFFLDYDGTLAPIVDDPMQAHPHEAVPEILESLSELAPVYIVTGRFLADLQDFITMPIEAIGLHGIQRGTLGGRLTDAISDEARHAIVEYRKTAPQNGGIHIEEKGPLFAVHYRRANDKEAARETIRAWLGDVPASLSPIWGKDVVELRPADVSKGTAVREVADRHRDRTPIYLGDDVTDEDAFRALGNDAVTVKVGPGETDARYRLDHIEDVIDYLRRYL